MTQYVSPVMRRFDGYPEQWLYPATDEWTVGGGQIGTGTGTQALTAINHYSVALTTPIASGYPADASDKTLTAVTSTSAFTKNQGVLALVKPLTV